MWSYGGIGMNGPWKTPSWQEKGIAEDLDLEDEDGQWRPARRGGWPRTGRKSLRSYPEIPANPAIDTAP